MAIMEEVPAGLGEKLAVNPAGQEPWFIQLSVTAELKPFCGVIVSETLAACPAMRVCAAGVLSEKSGDPDVDVQLPTCVQFGGPPGEFSPYA